MWPFSRNLHRLPKFPPQIIPLFRSLCTDISVEQLPQLQQEFSDLKTKILDENKGNRLFDKRLAEKIFEACEILLDSYAHATTSQRRLIVGALKYCIISEDPFPDTVFASGLRDDAKIVNHVLEQIGQVDKVISLE